MAVLYITEYSSAPNSVNDIPSIPANASQTVAIGGSTTASSAFQSNTTLIGLSSDAVCSVAFGTAPTATATTRRIAANTVEQYVKVPQGQNFKVAAITNT